MKNIRKIVALLAAALMLFTVLPMGAFAAKGDVVFSNDFNDGEKKFDLGDIVAEGPDGSNCYKWTATGGWSATYMVVKNMDPAKDYTITMKAKGSVAGGMGITIQNGDWGSYWNGPTFNVTTEWQDIVVEMPAGSIPFAAGSIVFKWQDVGVAMDLYIDDLVIAEGLPEKPLCENGDFENGNTGWGLNQSTVIDATAAKNGNNGAHLKGNGGWGSMLERTLDTVAGKEYRLSFWIKAIASGTNIQVKENTWQGADIAGTGGWFDKTEWTQITYTFTATTPKTYLNFCGSGSAAEELYVDDVVMLELKDPSFDGYIYNGDFEPTKDNFWTNLWGSSAIELVAGRDGGYALKGTASGAWQIVYQEVAVTPNTNYTVWAYAKDAVNSALWIKNAGGEGDITSKNFASGSDWSLTSVTFNSGSNNTVWIGLMGLEAGSTYTVDDIFMFEAKEASNDGYIINGTFETGSVSPWENLWGSCPTVEIIKGGKDDTFALNLVSGKWNHFRQTAIAVEANTDYKISLWAKNVNNISLLVKDNADTHNIANSGINGGDEWTYNEFTFNTGADTSVLVSLMGGEGEGQHGIFDNIVMEKIAPACEHEYFSPCDQHCMICGELTNPDASHNIVHVEAVDATCTEMGNIEYWYCDVCGMAWLDEACTLNTNLMAVKLPALGHIYADDCSPFCEDCGEEREVPPHTLTYVEAVVATNCQETGHDEYWKCETCGRYFGDAEGSYQLNPGWIYYTGECVRPEGVADCAVVPCTLCGNDTYGEGEHDTGVAACQTGTCSKCNAEIEGYGCQNNGSACQDGQCVYCGGFVAGLGHENGAWAPCVDGECSYGCGLTYPATEDHVDEDANDYCDNCWNHLAHIDEDGNGECDVCWTMMPVVEIIYGDADGDGEVTLYDATLISLYLSGNDVEIIDAFADADGDGEVTLYDATLVTLYLSGNDVTLGPQQ